MEETANKTKAAVGLINDHLRALSKRTTDTVPVDDVRKMLLNLKIRHCEKVRAMEREVSSRTSDEMKVRLAVDRILRVCLSLKSTVKDERLDEIVALGESALGGGVSMSHR